MYRYWIINTVRKGKNAEVIDSLHSLNSTHTQSMSILNSSKSIINSLWPLHTICHHRALSTLVQVMAWCLMAPSHYMNKCWSYERASRTMMNTTTVGSSESWWTPTSILNSSTPDFNRHALCFWHFHTCSIWGVPVTPKFCTAYIFRAISSILPIQ